MVLVPAGGAFLVVVEGLDLPDLEGALPGRQQLDAVHRIVVKVMMAAVDRVGLRLQRRIPLHSGVGVRHDPVAVLFQQKNRHVPAMLRAYALPPLM